MKRAVRLAPEAEPAQMGHPGGEARRAARRRSPSGGTAHREGPIGQAAVDLVEGPLETRVDDGVERQVLLLDGGDGGLGQLAWLDLSLADEGGLRGGVELEQAPVLPLPGFVDAPWRAPAVVQSGRMEGLRVVVTGAARGSVALATELRQRGAEVVTLDINPDGVDHQCDVSDAEQVEAVFDDIGDIDGLVNNAALLVGRRRFEDIPLDEWERMLAVNVTGTFLCTRAASSRMPRGGSIVNLASETAFTGSFGFVHTRGVQGRGGVDVAGPRPRARPRNIRVNTVAPGFTPETAGRACWAGGDVRRERHAARPGRHCLRSPRDDHLPALTGQRLRERSGHPRERRPHRPLTGRLAWRPCAGCGVLSPP